MLIICWSLEIFNLKFYFLLKALWKLYIHRDVVCLFVDILGTIFSLYRLRNDRHNDKRLMSMHTGNSEWFDIRRANNSQYGQC